MKKYLGIIMLIGSLFLLCTFGCLEEGGSSDSFFGIDEFEIGELKDDGPDGKPLLRAYLDNYVLDGEMKSWYKNGQLQLKQAFVGGYGNSDYQTWYSNGQRRFYGNLEKGKFQTWHLNGVMSIHTDTLTPKGEVALMEWNEQGEIINIKLKNEKGEYFQQRQYYPGEILGAEGPLLSGNKKGKWRYYDKAGELLHIVDHQPGFSGKPPLPKMGLEGLVSAEERAIEDFEIIPEPLNLDAIQAKIGYPMIARDAGIEGQVSCRVRVTRSGEIVNYQILSSPHPILSSAVIARVLQLRFKPLKGKSTYKIYQVNIPFNFALVD